MADGDPHTPPGHRLTERLTERRRSRPMALDSAFTLVDRLAERLLALGDADEAFLDEGVGLTYLTYPTDPEELRWTETGRRPTSDRVASRPWSSPQPRVRTPMSALRTPPRAARAARTAPPTTVVQPPPDSAAAIDASAPSRSRSPSVRTPPRSRSEASPPTAAADRAFQGAPRATTLAASSRAATESRSAPARPWASAHRTGGSRVPRPGPAERILRDVAARTRGSQRAVARTAARDWASAPQGASPRAGVLPSAVAAGAHPRAPQPVSLEAPSRAPGEAGSAQARAGSRGRGRAVAHRLLERAGSSRHEAPEASGTVRTAGRGWSQRPALHTVSAPVEGAPVGGTDRTRSGGASEAAPRAATRSRATAPAADSVAPTRSRVRSETVRTAAGERAPTSAQHTPVRARSLSRAVARTWLAEEGSGVQAPATDPGGARSWAGARTLTLPEAGEPAPREQAEAGSSGARRGSARGLRTPRGARALSRAVAARSERMAGARTLRSRGPGPALASLREPGEAASVQAERGVAGVRSVLEAPTAAVDAVASGQSGGRAVAGSPVRTSPRTPRAMPTVSLASDDAQPMPAAARGAARAERTVRAAQRVVTPQRTSLSGEEPSGSASTPGPSQPGATRVVTRSASSTAGIAQKLMRLINLAERERSAAEAEELVRMSEAHSAGQGPGPGESAAEDSSVNIQALHRDVLEAVLRELDNLQWRREDPDGPNFWC